MKKSVLFIILVLSISSCRARFENRYAEIASKYSVCSSSEVYHYIMYSPYYVDEGGLHVNHQLIYLDDLKKQEVLLDLREPVSVNVFYLDSENKLRHKKEIMTSVVPDDVRAISDWGLVLGLKECDLLYLMKTKEFYRVLEPTGDYYCDEAINKFPIGALLRYEYKDLEPFLTKLEYSSGYSKEMSYFIPILINKDGEIELDPNMHGKLALCENYASPFGVDIKTTQFSYNDLFSESAKQTIVSLIKEEYKSKMEIERKQQIQERAINPKSIILEYQKNAVKAERDLVGKYFILRNIDLTHISYASYSDYDNKYFMRGEFEYDQYSTGHLELYTDDDTFVNFNYPVVNRYIEGRLEVLRNDDLVFSNVSLIQF